jgi:hypothetical protein
MNREKKWPLWVLWGCEKVSGNNGPIRRFFWSCSGISWSSVSRQTRCSDELSFPSARLIASSSRGSISLIQLIVQSSLGNTVIKLLGL